MCVKLSKKNGKKITSWMLHILLMPYCVLEIWWVFCVCNTFQFRLIDFYSIIVVYNGIIESSAVIGNTKHSIGRGHGGVEVISTVFKYEILMHIKVLNKN